MFNISNECRPSCLFPILGKCSALQYWVWCYLYVSHRWPLSSSGSSFLFLIAQSVFDCVLNFVRWSLEMIIWFFFSESFKVVKYINFLNYKLTLHLWDEHYFSFDVFILLYVAGFSLLIFVKVLSVSV